MFLKIGMNVRWEGLPADQPGRRHQRRRAPWLQPTRTTRLRASGVADPLFARKNTRDNTPP